MDYTLQETLKKYFGYTTFRPYQEEIISDVLKNIDTLAILPTGAGKSLCFQLPALLETGVTFVVSPLIALMKDQVDQLTANGINATFLNSSIVTSEFYKRLEGIRQKKFKLVYVAPERLLMDGFLEKLQNIEISRFAIDEAHCISEWGHDFRPEYRELSKLKIYFPKVPVISVTATATKRVREDIVNALSLIDHKVHVASFNRPNLSYKVVNKKNTAAQICGFVENFREDSGIIYCGTRDKTEEVVRILQEEGHTAVPYHAGLNQEERSINQDKFIKDEVSIVCATVAFGMGINKPNVRYVVHCDLPKNIESYYQETGRAGRDGLPSECLLLFSVGDAARIRSFINQKTDQNEIAVASQQLSQIVAFGQTNECRRKFLLQYFGETAKFENCGNCDNCVEGVEQLDGTTLAHKFLSCIYRVQQLSDMRFGIGHIVAILLGKNTEKIQRWGHSQLPTYGIGKEKTEKEWVFLGHQFIRLGLVELSNDQYPTCSLTKEGTTVLKNRLSVMITKQRDVEEYRNKSKSKITFNSEPDNDLLLQLKKLRTAIAREMNVPPYIVFGDVTLVDMVKRRPRTQKDLLNIHGIGAVKLEQYGERFLALINEYYTGITQSTDDDPKKPAKISKPSISKKELLDKSYQLYIQGRTIKDIATDLDRSPSTIVGYLIESIESGRELDINKIISGELVKKIDKIIEKETFTRLAPIKESIGDAVSYEQLHLYRAWRARHSTR